MDFEIEVQEAAADCRWRLMRGQETVLAGSAATRTSALAHARFAAGAVAAFGRLARRSDADSVAGCARSATSWTGKLTRA